MWLMRWRTNHPALKGVATSAVIQYHDVSTFNYLWIDRSFYFQSYCSRGWTRKRPEKEIDCLHIIEVAYGFDLNIKILPDTDTSRASRLGRQGFTPNENFIDARLPNLAWTDWVAKNWLQEVSVDYGKVTNYYLRHS